MMKTTKTISNKVHRLTWLPVPSKCLIVTLPQNEEINHIWHVMIPVQEISVALMRENNKHRVVDEYTSLKKTQQHQHFCQHIKATNIFILWSLMMDLVDGNPKIKCRHYVHIIQLHTSVIIMMFIHCVCCAFSQNKTLPCWVDKGSEKCTNIECVSQ